MSEHGVQVERSSFKSICDCFFFGSTIDVQTLQSWAMGIERIPVFINYDGYANS
jgi:hypothetical protein